MSLTVKIVLSLLTIHILMSFHTIQARFRFPAIRRPLPSSTALSSMESIELTNMQRAASYENINLRQRASPSLHAASSSESIRSATALNRPASSAIMAGSVAAAAGSVYNVDRTMVNDVGWRLYGRPLPHFITDNMNKIKVGGKIAEKTGIALAAGGGAVVLLSGSSKSDEATKKTELNDYDATTAATPITSSTHSSGLLNPIGYD